jgi:predicted RNA-binding Zn-ribbon protein involved in translation (DUF1610 family)
MEPKCAWCGSVLTGTDNVSILCADCIVKRDAKRADLVARKAAIDKKERENRWDPLAPIKAKTKYGTGTTVHTYIRCPGCKTEVETTSREIYITCPNCGKEKLQIRQPAKPVL